MSEQESQPYYRALKSLFGDEAAEIIPNLVPESEFLHEENIEIDRTTLKADLVYHILYKGQPHILNMELQTDADSNMPRRMLKYHVGLHDKHGKPVISVIVYPFETSIPASPYREMSGDEVLLTFHYKVLALWLMEAEPFVRNHVVCMYSLLPAMKGANAHLLLQVIEEMKQHYQGPKLGDHLARFQKILRRSSTMPELDKQIVEEALNTYDSLMDDSPVAIRNLAKGEIRGLQQMALEAVEDRFPSLVRLAQERIALIRQPEVLRQLVKQVYHAPDEKTALWLLSTFTDR